LDAPFLIPTLFHRPRCCPIGFSDPLFLPATHSPFPSLSFLPQYFSSPCGQLLQCLFESFPFLTRGPVPPPIPCDFFYQIVPTLVDEGPGLSFVASSLHDPVWARPRICEGLASHLCVFLCSPSKSWRSLPFPLRPFSSLSSGLLFSFFLSLSSRVESAYLFFFSSMSSRAAAPFLSPLFLGSCPFPAYSQLSVFVAAGGNGPVDLNLPFLSCLPGGLPSRF